MTSKIKTVIQTNAQGERHWHHAFHINGIVYINPRPIGLVGHCIRP